MRSAEEIVALFTNARNSSNRGYCYGRTGFSLSLREGHTMKHRIENDTMGEMRVPESALYGAQTARALLNFPISGKHFPRSYIRALGLIKSCAAHINGRMGH